MVSTMDDDTTVRRELDLDIDAADLWELVGDGDRWAEWLVGSADVEVTDGALGAVVDDDGTARRVLVERVEPGRAVSFMWWPSVGPDHCSRVDLVVIPREHGSRLVVTEVLASAEAIGRAMSWELRALRLWSSAGGLVSA
jgi:uncharacterized protein YndB with AHSA1/START domain